MRILFLTQVIPYPLDAGPKIKTWHVLRYLIGCGHDVILVSFIRPEEEPHMEALRGLCSAVHAVPIRRSRVADLGGWVRSYLTGRPFLIERDDLASMRELVSRLIQVEPINLIHADQLTMTQFALLSNKAGFGLRRWVEARPRSSLRRTKRPPGERRGLPLLLFDAHNAVWKVVDRACGTAPWFLRPLLAVEARRIKHYEGIATNGFDHTLAVSEPDRQALIEAARIAADGAQAGIDRAQDRITVIPIAIDTAQLQPVQRKQRSLNVLTLGTLHYPPNADGIRWFVRDVFPLVREAVPDAQLSIVGKNPPRDLTQHASRNPECVSVKGYVPDLGPYLEQAALIVVPVRAGGGMRVRILEAFARGIPVVTTGVGLEGIEATPDTHVLVGNTSHEFAAQVVRLLKDEALQVRLANHARRLAVQRYDWQVVLKKLDEVYAHLGDRNSG